MEMHAQDFRYEAFLVVRSRSAPFLASNPFRSSIPLKKTEKETAENARAFWKVNADEIVTTVIAYTSMLENAKGTCVTPFQDA